MAKRKEPSSNGSASSDAGLEKLRTLVEILDSASLTELSYEDADVAVSLRRGGVASEVVTTVAAPVHAVPAAAPASTAAAAEDAGENLHVVHSPFVGTFYRAPSVGASPFTDVGQRVTKGQTVCIVEAMKLMNEIECDADGVVAEILVENGHAVQYGDALFKIRPA